MAALGGDVSYDECTEEVSRMPFWAGYWEPPWAGFGWIFPLIGLLFMVVMALFCVRMMSGMMSGGCMTSHGRSNASEMEDLRREVRELKEEIRKLGEKS